MLLTSCSAKKEGKENKVEPLIDRKRKKRPDEVVVVEEEEEKSGRLDIIREGDFVNISDLLFTEHRDYLVKYNGERVKADQLAGKVVVIYFSSLCAKYERRHLPTAHLIEIYNELSGKSAFEVVFVAIGDDPSERILKSLDPWHRKSPEQRFAGKFSYMPWAAIPHSDLLSRRRLERNFFLPRLESCEVPVTFVIDPRGSVLHCDAQSLFRFYGAEAYPFSNERLEFLRSEDEAVTKQPSLKTLLASPQRDYVISNRGKQVRISDLEGKVVALYLYEHGCTDDITKKLKMVYRKLRDHRKRFEVVLVNIHFGHARSNENFFWEAFETMPWLALPFKDWNCRKLVRIFDYPLSADHERGPDPSLVIIGPNGKFVEPFCADILMKYGTKAYPFTREKAAKLEAERVKKLNLYSLWVQNVVLKRIHPSQDVQLSELFGKRIIIFIEGTNVHSESAEFIRMLKLKYIEKKGKDDEFEVIYICLSSKEVTYNERVAELPWLVHPFCEDFSYANKITEPVFDDDPTPYCSALVAFERDGRLVTKATRYGFDANENMEFPFASDLETETLGELTHKNYWNLSDGPTSI